LASPCFFDFDQFLPAANGLTGQEARERPAVYGQNRLPERRRKHPVMAFWRSSTMC